MKNSTCGFVIEKLKCSIFISLASGVIIYLLTDLKTFMGFYIGYITGCVNFITMSLGIWWIIGRKPNRTRAVHLLTFTVRYLLIGAVFFELVKGKNANIFALVFGFLIINISIVLGNFNKNADCREEA